MNRDNINIALLFVGLILLQIIVLNNINFLGYINPFFYIIFIFLYPLRKIESTLILLSFFLGLFIDIFSNSGGTNAAATLLIAFIRIPVLKIILDKRELEYSSLSINKLPFYKSLTFIAVLTFIHHFLVFSLEYFKWINMNIILVKTSLTSIFTIVLILISLTFVSRKR